MAMAHAYGVSEDVVGIRRPGEPWPDTPIIVELVANGYAPGDYPTQFLPWGPEDRIDDPAIPASLAVTFDAPVLTASDSQDPSEQVLFLPDGSAHTISVDQDDDGGIRNTPKMLQLIRGRVAPSHVRAA
ncbi:MAG: hypothetical protein WBA46_00830 [Thermomicrobiales bacterium]